MAGIGGSYGPNAGQSGKDSRGRAQNQSQYQQQRYEQQQGPLANFAALNYGRGADTNYNDYNDIMNRYGSEVAGGGGVTAGSVSYSDPFNSYGGYQGFSQNGGYSAGDIANMRSRGISPIRAAYSNAEREVGRQRSLQGGYSPNATATLAKMAREQGQSAADATQNVEAGLAEARNKGRLAGLAGMSNIEGQRLNAQLDAGKFNAQQQYLASMGNANNRLQGLQGMTSLYGATPGMANSFGDQAITLAGQGGNFGLNLMGRDIEGQKLPGQFDTTMDRIGQIYNTGASVAAPIWDSYQKRQQANQTRNLGRVQTNTPIQNNPNLNWGQ